MNQLIEFVCSHNQGRSPIAEAFARKYALVHGARGIEFISSGSHVNEINGNLDGTIPIPGDIVRLALEMGFNRGLLGEEVREHIAQDSLTEEHIAQLQDKARYVFQTFVDEEHMYRAEAFRQFGLGEPKEAHEQTIVRPSVTYVLGMDRRNVDMIRTIYGAVGARLPILETLAGFALRQPGAKFKSAFGGTLQDYLQMAEVIKDYAEKSVDRVVRHD